MTKRSGFLLPANLIAAWLMLASAWQVLAVDPVVSNVQTKQREGSRLVDITYDVADPDSPTLTVYLKVSPDGGKTWKGPVELVSGDVGQHIAPGTAKKLVWDAGKELPNQFGTKFRYKVGASDQWLAPQGMALIPAGPFQMGDDRVIGAKPVHTVTVSTFAMDKWEVSIELWESIRAWGSAHGYDLVAGDSDGAKHPVRSVSWFDAVKWCNARSEKEGKTPAYYEDAARGEVYRSGEKNPAGVNWEVGYRLPTEAEWEKAARGGVENKLYSWGADKISPDLANYRDSKKGGTTTIDSYGANEYGLYGMTGNVMEWCWDWSGAYMGEWAGGYTESPKDNPRGLVLGTIRVFRGGCWALDVEYCSVAHRNFIYFSPDAWFNKLNGFRCVLPAGQP